MSIILGVIAFDYLNITTVCSLVYNKIMLFGWELDIIFSVTVVLMSNKYLRSCSFLPLFSSRVKEVMKRKFGIKARSLLHV